MSIALPVFKSWVPVWLIRITIFMLIVPSLMLFTMSAAAPANAMGYYGIEPSDVQYSVIVFYAAVAGFVALERRFFIFVATKEYFVICMIIQMVTSYVCFNTHNMYVLFPIRFIQGMANCMSTSILITLIFSSLQSERAKEIGYSVFYGLLLAIAPISGLMIAPIVDAFDFNALYKFITYSFLPGSIILLLIMNNVRLNKKIPLYQVDFYSFFLYSAMLCCLGYVFIYGQQYYWLQDKRIIWNLVAVVALMAIFVFRQIHLKRPYIDLAVFKSRNFVVGTFMIFALYLVRGAFGITTTYFGTTLGMDPINIAYLLIINIVGIVCGILVSSRLIILKRSMRLTWLYGFFILLIYHTWMWFLFTTQADASTFMVPLFLQGAGVGMLMAPIIVFMISSVPPHLGSSASSAGVFFRFSGFIASIALVNYFLLRFKTDHINRFQDHMSLLNPVVSDRLKIYTGAMTSKGVAPDQAAKIARGLLNRSVEGQASLRTLMDYYFLTSIFIVVILLIIALFPYLNRTTISLKSNQPAPAGY